MRFARIAGRINKGVYTTTFGIRLEGIRILTSEEHQSYEDFSMTLLGRQMDFIHSLHELAEDFAIELRYLFNPQEPHLIKVYFLVQVTGSKKSNVCFAQLNFPLNLWGVCQIVCNYNWIQETAILVHFSAKS